MVCNYCYADGGSYGNLSMMTEAVAYRSLDWLYEQSKDAGKLAVTFFGGEPLLNIPLIRKTVRYAEEKAKRLNKKCRYSLCTNALLLDESMIDFLKAHDFRVLIGFDGPPLIHNRNRPLLNGGPSHKRVSAHIKGVLKALPGRIFLRATLVHAEELPQVVEHLSEFEVPHFQIVFASPGLHPANRGKPAYPGITPETVRFFEKRTDQFLRAVRSRNWKEVQKLTRWSEFQNMIQISGNRHRRLAHCGMGRKMAAVSTDGTLFPCHRFVGLADHEMGNVNSHELNLRHYSDSSPRSVEPCASCWARLRCSGRCLYNNLAKTGNMLQPAPQDCAWLKTRIRSGIHLEHHLSQEDRRFLSRCKVLPKRPCVLDF